MSKGSRGVETTVENRVVQSADGKHLQQCTTGFKGFTGVKGSDRYVEGLSFTVKGQGRQEQGRFKYEQGKHKAQAERGREKATTKPPDMNEEARRLAMNEETSSRRNE